MSPPRFDERSFLDWNLLYLFSYDVELDLKAQEKLGAFPEGVRMNCFARRDLSHAYSVGRDATVAGSGVRAISGKIVWGGDALTLRDDDIASSDIRVAIQTDDEATIHMYYNLIGYVGPGGVSRIVDGTGDDSLGSEEEPFEAPHVTSPTFQCAHPSYDWMNRVQAIGFGRAQLVRSKFRRLTADVYALT